MSIKSAMRMAKMQRLWTVKFRFSLLRQPKRTQKFFHTSQTIPTGGEKKPKNKNNKNKRQNEKTQH